MPRTAGVGCQKVCEEGASICCITSVINGPSDRSKREDQPGGSVTVEYSGKRESWEKCNIYKYKYPTPQQIRLFKVYKSKYLNSRVFRSRMQ